MLASYLCVVKRVSGKSSVNSGSLTEIVIVFIFILNEQNGFGPYPGERWYLGCTGLVVDSVCPQANSGRNIKRSLDSVWKKLFHEVYIKLFISVSRLIILIEVC